MFAKLSLSILKAVVDSSYEILFYEILFCLVKHFPKILLLTAGQSEI